MRRMVEATKDDEVFNMKGGKKKKKKLRAKGKCTS
jgi:hypothetical protein